MPDDNQLHDSLIKLLKEGYLHFWTKQWKVLAIHIPILPALLNIKHLSCICIKQPLLVFVNTSLV